MSRNLLEKYVLDCMCSPFPKITYRHSPLPPWSSFSELCVVLSPGLQFYFAPNKSNVKLSCCVFFQSTFPTSSTVLIEVLLIYDSNVIRYLKFLSYMGVECCVHFRCTAKWFRDTYTLEKAMAPHSSTLAWKIPWTGEPGGLPSMGLHRVGHDWAPSLSCIGEGNGNPLQCSCLENPKDRGAW